MRRERRPLPRRIVLVGPESTGKSTLAPRLAAALHSIWVPEYARDYAAASLSPLTGADVDPIARGQALREWQAARFCAAGSLKCLVVDSGLLATWVYARRYYGREPQAFAPTFGALRQRDLYLLMAPDLPWVADTVRDPAGPRQQLFGAFKRALEHWGCRYTAVSGHGGVRERRAWETVQRWRATS